MKRLKQPLRYAIDGIHVVSYPQGATELHPQALAYAEANGLLESEAPTVETADIKPVKRKRQPRKKAVIE